MADASDIDDLLVRFSLIPDLWEDWGLRHSLVDVLFIAIVAMISGADDAEAMEDFGEAHEEWFRGFLELRHGIQSQDTYLHIFAILDPATVQTLFRDWVSGLRTVWQEGHVAIDGKTLRRSFDSASGGKSIHMVSAWLCEQGLVLGQVKVAQKANEIVAIPELLRLLDIRGVTVTIDAMGCQRAIAAQIVEQAGHYVLSVKDNHPKLHEQIERFFQAAGAANRGDIRRKRLLHRGTPERHRGAGRARRTGALGH